MKYFVISDIHSFYDNMITALNNEGFKQNCDEHMLIISGDVFDRGSQSQELRDWLTETTNKVCIFGNHERLMLDAINNGQFGYHDLTNGTIDAAIQLSGGYDAYPKIQKCGKAKDFFKKVDHYSGQITNPWMHEKIIKNLIDTNIVEWIVDNFYIDTPNEKKGVVWNKIKTQFTIKGIPRYYVQVNDRLMLHGFFPSPAWVKSHERSNGQTFSASLPDDYDLLEESSQYMWEQHGYGIWSNTPYWLNHFHKFKLEKLLAYLVRRDIKHIYMGHWRKSEVDNMIISLSLSPAYEKYHDKKPRLHFTDDAVVLTGNVIVETFTI